MEKSKKEEARKGVQADLIEGLNKWREKYPHATLREIEEEIDQRLSKMRARLITDTVMKSVSAGTEKKGRNLPEMRRGGKEEGEEETEAGNDRRAGYPKEATQVQSDVRQITNQRRWVHGAGSGCDGWSRVVTKFHGLSLSKGSAHSGLCPRGRTHQPDRRVLAWRTLIGKQSLARETLAWVETWGPKKMLLEFQKLQRKHPQEQVMSGNLAYLKKREAQIQYPNFQAQGWPIGSGIVESGNKLVVETRLKGAGMHWHEKHVNPMLALRTMICSKRWKQEWTRIEARLRNKRPPQKAPATAPTVLTEMEAFDLILKEKLENDSVPFDPSSTSQKKRTSLWKNFKHGKALYQRMR
jgi:hypothetical protein